LRVLEFYQHLKRIFYNLYSHGFFIRKREKIEKKKIVFLFKKINIVIPKRFRSQKEQSTTMSYRLGAIDDVWDFFERTVRGKKGSEAMEI